MAKEFKDGLKIGGTDIFSNNGIYLEFYHIPTNKSIKFKAYITNYNETYDTSFDPVDVYGRLDPITIYKGTKRTISLGWDVVAETEAEAYTNLQRVQKYIQMMYPRYNEYVYGSGRTSYSVSVVGAPPLLKMKFINLIADSSRSAFQKVEEEADTDRDLNSIGVGPSRKKEGRTPFGGLGIKEFDLREVRLSNLYLGADKAPKKSNLIKFGYTHGTAKTHGIIVAPGSLTVDNHIHDEGSLIRSINCGVAVLPTKISLATTYTVIHNHDLGESDRYSVKTDAKKINRKFKNKSRRFQHFPYGAQRNIKRLKK